MKHHRWVLSALGALLAASAVAAQKVHLSPERVGSAPATF